MIFRSKNKIALITLLVVFFLSSCEKNVEKEVTALDKQASITSQSRQNSPAKRLDPLLPTWDDSSIIKVYVFKEQLADTKKASILIDGQSDTLSFDKRFINFLSDISDHGKRGNKVKIVLFADKDIPFGLIRYFEFLLRLNNINRIGYGNSYQEHFLTAFPPIPRKVYGSQKKWRATNFDDSTTSLLKAYGVDSVYNCKIEVEKLVLKAKNLLLLEVDSSFSVEHLDQELSNLFKDQAWHQKVVHLKTNDFVDYELIFNAHAQILSYYHQLWNNASEEAFGLPLKDLETKQKRKIKNQIPMVFARNQYSNIVVKKD